MVVIRDTPEYDRFSMEIESIGFFRCAEVHRYDAARQPAASQNNSGTIELKPGRNFEQALSHLEGFSHVWLLFQFHKNDHWKPMVRPPRGNHKVGVFASRTPYRPNSIGMSCVRLGAIRGLRIDVHDHDLLDGTPILDIKPYIPYADSVPEASSGWLDDTVGAEYAIEQSATFQRHIAWLKERDVGCIEAFLVQQLSFEPSNSEKKRVRHLEADSWEIAYRTWRVVFTLDETEMRITLQSVHSGYSDADLADPNDPHNDKEIHRAFVNDYPAVY